MKRTLTTCICVFAFAQVATAGSPDNPGGFGTKRADNTMRILDGGDRDLGLPGASEWGTVYNSHGDEPEQIWNHLIINNDLPNPDNDQGSGNDGNDWQGHPACVVHGSVQCD